MRLARTCTLSLLTITALCPGASRAASTTTHVVEHGDTLWALAQTNGCTVAELRAANGFDRDDPLVLGDEIIVPRCAGEVAREHLVAKGETLSGIAERYELTLSELRAANRLDGNMIRVGQRLRLPKPKGQARAGQSRGHVDEGTLHEPTQLPQNAAYYRRRLPRTYATAPLVRHTIRAVEAVRARWPEVHRLAIGDLSDADGGPLTGHRTHQSGRDIDLGFYFLDAPAGYPKQFAAGTGDNLDADRTWALLEGFVRTADEPDGVELVYLDYEIQRSLYAAARRDGWTVEQLARVFEYPDGRGASGRVVRHLWNHHDHLHVRFRCPPGDGTCE